MIEEDARLIIDGQQHNGRWLRFEDTDTPMLRQQYDNWRTLTEAMVSIHARKVNFPDGISEGVFSLQFNSPKIISVTGTAGSFDCFNPATNMRLQIKATSVDDDLTSFGPRSVWDELFFMDFFNGGIYDGSYDVYQIPNNLIRNFQINSTETFTQQQQRGVRPRLHMKRSIIEPNGIIPIGHFMI